MLPVPEMGVKIWGLSEGRTSVGFIATESTLHSRGTGLYHLQMSFDSKEPPCLLRRDRQPTLMGSYTNLSGFHIHTHSTLCNG